MLSAILLIGILFIVILIFPLLPIVWALYRDKEWLFRAFVALPLGMFTCLVATYVLSIVNQFAVSTLLLAYLVPLVVLDVYCLRRWPGRIAMPTVRVTPAALMLLTSFALGAYLRLGDPVGHLSLGTEDFYWHLRAIRGVGLGRVLISYPIGYHLLMAMIHRISGLDLYTFARFAGAALGILSIGATYVFVRELYGDAAGAFAALLYSGFPAFRDLILIETGLFPTGIAFLLVPFILYFALEIIRNIRTGPFPYRDTVVVSCGLVTLGLMVPYVTLQVTCALLALLGLALVRSLMLRRELTRVALVSCVFALGLVTFVCYYVALDALFHVVLEAQVLETTGNATLIATRQPLLLLADFLSFKGFRSPPFPLSVGVYSALLLTVSLLAWGIYKNHLRHMFVGGFGTLFGVAYLTGWLEWTTYRARSGWFLMLAAAWMGGVLAAKYSEETFLGDVVGGLNEAVTRSSSGRGVAVPRSLSSAVHRAGLLAGFAGYLGFLVLSARPGQVSLVTLPIPIAAGAVLGYFTLKAASERPVPTRRSWLASRLLRAGTSTALLFLLFVPAPRPPEYYRHGYEDNVEATLRIMEEFPLKSVEIYSTGMRLFPEREFCMTWPEAKVLSLELLGQANFERENVFIFIEKEIFRIDPQRTYIVLANADAEVAGWTETRGQVMRQAKLWVDERGPAQGNVLRYYETENIVVYLLKPSDTAREHGENIWFEESDG